MWYMQPHYPWILHRELSLKLVNEVVWGELSPRDVIGEGLEKKGISQREIVRAYLSNVEIALRYASIFLKEIMDMFTGKIVITSDHGEFLGEYGLYLHHPNYELPQMCVVPWFEVK